MRKTINKEYPDIICYQNTEQMRNDILKSIRKDIKYVIEKEPYHYKHSWIFRFKLHEKADKNDILNMVVDKLVKTGYVNDGCKCVYNKEKDEYCIKIHILLYSVTQDEKVKLKIAEWVALTIPSGIILVSMIVLLLYLLKVTISPLIFIVCLLILTLPTLIVYIAEDTAQKIVKKKYQKQTQKLQREGEGK